MLIWRGAGIIIPIFIVISAWLTGYSFEDVSIGNASFMSWMLLWPGILITLIGLGFWPLQKNPETGKLTYVGNHDLFWIPMIVWGVLILGYSIKLFNTEVPGEETYIQAPVKKAQSQEDYILKTYPKNSRELLTGQRALKLYNPTDAPLKISFYDEAGETEVIEATVDAFSTVFTPAKKGVYIVEYSGKKKKVDVTPSTTTNNYNTDEIWIVLGENTDLLLVDATETCYEELTRKMLKEIDWESKIYQRYDGKQSIMMNIEQTPSLYFKTRDPYYSLPLTHMTFAQVYSVIPISKDSLASDDYIQSFLGSICFKTEGVTVK